MEGRVRENKTQIIQTVIGIIKRDNKFLLNERPKDKPYSGYWEFPGGKIEPNESSQAALARELEEELGISVRSSEFWFQHKHAYPDKIVTLEIWFITEFVGEPQGKENQILQWMDLESIPQINLLDGNWEIINRLQELSYQY